MTGGKRRRYYSTEDIQQAIQAQWEEGMSLRQASKPFSLPKLTILDHLSQDHGLDRSRLPYLSKEEELRLLEKIQVLVDWGFPLTGQDCAIL